MWSLPRNLCVVVVVNGCFDAGLCVVFSDVAKVKLSESIRALDRKSAMYVRVYDVVSRSAIAVYCGRLDLSGWILHNSLLAVVGE